ncbi:MAG: hypothetical protein OWQ57_10410 [Sulfobacillus sp.]|nr:hypothetical protein [Sulfobacillus sp.]
MGGSIAERWRARADGVLGYTPDWSALPVPDTVQGFAGEVTGFWADPPVSVRIEGVSWSLSDRYRFHCQPYAWDALDLIDQLPYSREVPHWQCSVDGRAGTGCPHVLGTLWRWLQAVDQEPRLLALFLNREADDRAGSGKALLIRVPAALGAHAERTRAEFSEVMEAVRREAMRLRDIPGGRV